MVIDKITPMEKVRSVVPFYTPLCLMPALLTRVHSPHEAWDIIRNSPKNLRISETFSPLWA